MASLTKKVRGNRGINWHVARHSDVKEAVRSEATKGSFKATSQLGAHRAEGHSYIALEQGKKGVDWFVTLNDERGQRAALTIEYGRKGTTKGSDGKPVPPMPAVKPLRTAFPALDRRG